MHILLASPRAGALAEFIAGLQEQGARVETCPSGEQAVARARAGSPGLVVIDGDLPDLAPTRLVIELLKVNAMIPAAVLSPLSDAKFHEQTEGLGILARVPWNPDREDAATLLAALRKMNP